MKKITVMIVPPETTRVYKFQFSQKMFIGVAVLLLLVAVYSVIMIFTFGDFMYERMKNKSLSNRYKLLVEERENDRKRLNKMRKELFEMETMINKISVIIGTNVEYKTEAPPVSDEKPPTDVRWVGDQLKEYSYITRNSFLRLSAPKLSPVSGWISARFGPLKSPYTGTETMHYGIDIMAPEGRPVRSVVDGMIVNITTDDPVLGVSITIYGRWGFAVKYGHLKMIKETLKVGDMVAMGDYVGEVGTTGKTTGTHLHYQVELLNVPINPEIYGMEISNKGLLK